MMDAPMESESGPEMEQEDEQECCSVYLSKDSLGGKTFKSGDTITLTVQDVDPETGDVEASLAGGSEKAESSGYEKDFDRAMPPETEQEA